ncbi:MarR family winged helix-turn-helix transcriptional regulator [Deinococcus ruber]|uniref:MarR family transcriptional regulator n=1 Tax=Deinococcus ruber TaxID=1848197 RepID=A0A918C6E9_9DEIO|nr:MarR family winged helix-turn-helix transcriptional regulator [Deinococcus ruber]GGR07527.1 MarR family transcriptional regulator [Deinococcus ruber]
MVVEASSLGRAIKGVQYRHHRALDAGLTAVGTTLAQWDALRAIGEHPGSSAHTLASLTFQSDQAFGTLANRLAAQGLIERTSGHGRRIEHALTPAGLRVLEAGRMVYQSVLEASLAPLSEAERMTLLALLERIGGPAVR